MEDFDEGEEEEAKDKGIPDSPSNMALTINLKEIESKNLSSY